MDIKEQISVLRKKMHEAEDIVEDCKRRVEILEEIYYNDYFDEVLEAKDENRLDQFPVEEYEEEEREVVIDPEPFFGDLKDMFDNAEDPEDSYVLQKDIVFPETGYKDEEDDVPVIDPSMLEYIYNDENEDYYRGMDNVVEETVAEVIEEPEVQEVIEPNTDSITFDDYDYIDFD